MLVYKIFRRAEWEVLASRGETDGAPVDRADGFIHLSTSEQLAATAARHFADERDLVVAALEADGLDPLRWEPSRGGVLFPHLYRKLAAADVAWSRPAGGAAEVAGSLDGLPREAHVDPTRPQFDAFKALRRDTPVEMLNLVRFRDRAAYPAGHAAAGADATGAEAYARYGAAAGPVLRRVGGAILWRGRFEAVLIGPSDEHWDAVFVARYPTAGAFLAMVTDPEYRLAVVHRQAAVLTSRLIRCGAAEPGSGFG